MVHKANRPVPVTLATSILAVKITGIAILLVGVGVSIDWIISTERWESGIKGPVWMMGGTSLLLIGRAIEQLYRFHTKPCPKCKDKQ